ncbi:uncharacterized protein PHALS_14698 [Plasmopara halstedii]|uniref:Uncharacterized protein n=1 Tax=Plasmopara halstedii TaxID=4781 RepID=A0A0P1A6J7_PLAHL|nr:uncharacterized protein PHALS_14698 [Plasmopara halstedii]CEG35800.1 hypothetical protein PHALS_14698 [Plasmopara halstedii]|eukprot:XP_024572169.1 hypothetical protein PHALS_14698 [Plasmopara halstedii]
MFANTVCKWEHDSDDMETFSLANPLLAKDLHEEITKSDLHLILVDYLKIIICSISLRLLHASAYFCD